MSSFGDLDLNRGTGDLPPSRPPYGLWAAAGALALAAIVAVYFIFRPPTFTPAIVDEPAPARSLELPPSRPEPVPIELPPLDASDEIVRQLIRAISANPDLAAWLVTPDLVRVFVRMVEDVANGATPRRHLAFLAPDSEFSPAGSGERVRLDPVNYRRFDRVAAAADSVDAAGAARLYVTLRPLIDEAAGEIGYEPGEFDKTVARAIQRLVATPTVERDILLRPHGGVAWQFTDPQLEALAPVQKQFLGMGPRNMRLVQNKLRDMARALGMGT